VLREGIAALIADEADMTLVAEARQRPRSDSTVSCAPSGREADGLQMPEMNGLDALIAIRGEFPDARVIVLTTYARRRSGTARSTSGCPRLSFKK
jgi:DNA-binding NarL/FixJ family response regulator